MKMREIKLMRIMTALSISVEDKFKERKYTKDNCISQRRLTKTSLKKGNTEDESENIDFKGIAYYNDDFSKRR